MEVTRLKNEWTNEQWESHQRKVILEEYMEHLASQYKEAKNGRDKENFFDSPDRDVQSRVSTSERRAL
jgi:hypothetical protein